jgi:hypothetical protein
VEKELAEIGKTWKEAKREAANRSDGEVLSKPYAPYSAKRNKRKTNENTNRMNGTKQGEELIATI